MSKFPVEWTWKDKLLHYVLLVIYYAVMLIIFPVMSITQKLLDATDRFGITRPGGDKGTVLFNFVGLSLLIAALFYGMVGAIIWMIWHLFHH